MIFVDNAEELGSEIKFKRHLLRKLRTELSEETEAYDQTRVKVGTIISLERGTLKTIEDMFKTLSGVGMEVILRDAPGSHR